ncbi:MAG TPA: hypothetical protein VJV79_13055 [Polyangiaceae bacterium]|nr:hypothetical protein [Polyangiaceae bacterium]
MLLRPLLACALGTSLLLKCLEAHADPAAAEALFREGRTLLEQGEISAACEKLEASNALEPSAGTLLNLATCRLKQGRTATAWAHFSSAERIARNQSRPEQVAEAKRRASELEPRLSTLTLRAPGGTPGLEVRRAGQPVPAASFGTAVPIDPGLVVIDASAPGYEAARLQVTVGASADHHVLEIPKLRKLASDGSTSSAADTNTNTNAQENANPQPHNHSTVPWVIGGVGAAALVTGGVLGALAISSNAKFVDQNCADTRASGCQELEQRRNNEALASTLCVGAGVIGVGVAAIWLLTGRSGSKESAWSYQGAVTRESALLQLRVGF